MMSISMTNATCSLLSSWQDKQSTDRLSDSKRKTTELDDRQKSNQNKEYQYKIVWNNTYFVSDIEQNYADGNKNNINIIKNVKCRLK